MKIADIKLGQTVVYRTLKGTRETYIVKGFLSIPWGWRGLTRRVVVVEGTQRRFHPRDLAPTTEPTSFRFGSC